MGLRLDKEAREVAYDNRRVQLSAKEYKVLRLLMDNEDKIIGRDEILKSAWGYPDSDRVDRSVDAILVKLRRKLKLVNSEHRYLHTCYGFGYWFSRIE